LQTIYFLVSSTDDIFRFYSELLIPVHVHVQNACKRTRERERERENRVQTRPTPPQYMRFLSEKSTIFVRALLQKRRDICRGDIWRIQRALHKYARSLTTIETEPYTNMQRAQLKYAKGPIQICKEPYTNTQRALLKHAQSPTSTANEQYSRSRAKEP